MHFSETHDDLIIGQKILAFLFLVKPFQLKEDKQNNNLKIINCNVDYKYDDL